jgi:flagellar protein FlaG
MTINSIDAAAGGIVSTLLAAGRSGSRTNSEPAVALPGAQSPGDRSRHVPALTAAAMESLASDWQRNLADVAPEIEFSVDLVSGRSLIRVVDRTTDELIRQIPSEEALAISEAIEAFQKRLMPDQEA